MVHISIVTLDDLHIIYWPIIRSEKTAGEYIFKYMNNIHIPYITYVYTYTYISIPELQYTHTQLLGN